MFSASSSLRSCHVSSSFLYLNLSPIFQVSLSSASIM
jgi:hypothetical protein